jgi:hypothetical protein
VDCAFQSGAFQSNAFQVCVVVSTPRTGSHRRNKRIDYGGYQQQVIQETERYEMKLSEQLANQLQQAIDLNNKLLQANANLLQANVNITDAVSQIKATIEPAKPEMDPKKKAELMARLEAGRLAKAEKKRAEEEAAAKRRAQNLKNLAKARKARGK